MQPTVSAASPSRQASCKRRALPGASALPPAAISSETRPMGYPKFEGTAGHAPGSSSMQLAHSSPSTKSVRAWAA